MSSYCDIKYKLSVDFELLW